MTGTTHLRLTRDPQPGDRQPLPRTGSSEFVVPPLTLGESFPANRRLSDRNLLDLSRNEHRASPVAAELSRFSTIGIPDVERRTEYVAAGVVYEIAAEVVGAEVEVDVAGEGEDAWIGSEY